MKPSDLNIVADRDRDLPVFDDENGSAWVTSAKDHGAGGHMQWLHGGVLRRLGYPVKVAETLTVHSANRLHHGFCHLGRRGRSAKVRRQHASGTDLLHRAH